MSARAGVVLAMGLLATLVWPDGAMAQLKDPKREFRDDVRRVVELGGEAQQEALKALLEGRYDRYWDSVLYYESRLRPALRALLQDPKAGRPARALLAFIGTPEDLQLILQLAPPPGRRELFPDRWAYGVACALLEPRSEEEWAFLRKCALNEYQDRWVDAGAIQTLKLIASPRSREILEETRKLNPDRARSVARALEYIQSNPPPLTGLNLEALAQDVAQVIKIGDWEGNGIPRYSEAGDKALVDFTFHAGVDVLIYTATFHKINAVWKLRGARETLQMFVLRAVVPVQRPSDLLPPPPVLPPRPMVLPSLPPLMPQQRDEHPK